MKNFKFKWLLLSFVLSIASINTAWAGDQQCNFYGNNTYIRLWVNDSKDVYLNCNGSGVSDLELGVVDALYLAEIRSLTWKYNDGNVCRVRMHYGINTSRDGSKGSEYDTYQNSTDYGTWTGKEGADKDKTIEQFRSWPDKLNLLSDLTPGQDYYLDFYFTIYGSRYNNWACDDNQQYLSNGSGNYHVHFRVADTKSTFTAGKYFYFDARTLTSWQTDNPDIQFFFKEYYYGNEDVGNVKCLKTNALENWVYYVQVPSGSRNGTVEIDRVCPAGSSDPSEYWNKTNYMYACDRDDANQNCLVGSGSDKWSSWSPTWGTYCPPMSSATLSDNSTNKISWQDAGNDGSTSGKAILVSTSKTIEVSGAATKALDDTNMTINYDFKVGGSSAQAGSSNTYSKGSLSNNTPYTITMDAYNTYNGATGTKLTAGQTLYYKALDTYSVTNTLTNISSDGRSGSDAAAYNIAYTATLSVGTGYNLPAAITVKRGETTLTASTHYTYNSSTGALSINAAQVTGNLTIIAAGVAKTYTVTLDDNGDYNGNGTATAIYYTTTLTEISAPNRTGYHVTGYYTNDATPLYIADASGTLQASKSGYTDGSSRWTKDDVATLYAHWEANTHSLSWNANGGDELTGSYTSGTTAYGTTIVKPNTPTQSGSVFKGWAESADGDVVAVPPTMPDADKTYYAQWLSSADVSDCWDGETYNCGGIPNFATPKPGATTWSSATWGGGIPTLETEVVIPADMEITVDGTAFAKDVVLASTAKLNISSGAALIVANTVNKAGGSTSANDLTLSAGTSVTGNAALIWGKEGTTPGDASVGFYSKSHGQAGSSASVNQYIGVPVVTNTSAFGDAWVCHIKYEDNIAVWELHEGTMQPWVGYDLILNTTEIGGSCIMSGTLENNSDKPLNLVYQGDRTENLIANSWPAPIKISAFQNSDFTNAEPSIYIFNATSPDAQAKDETMHMGSYTAFTYGTATEVIPSMQSFSVIATSSSPSINLNYKRLVYDPAVASFTNQPNYAPKRTAVNEMTSLKINICDAQGWGDELKLFENSTDFSYEFEPGYDAHRLDGSSKAPHLYGLADDGSELAINCVPTMDNLPIGFKASAKDKEYTMSFKYDGEEELVLKDLKNNIETLINNESRYTFTSTSTDDDLRFVVIKKAPQIATKVENTTSNEETKVQKILHNGLLYIVRDGRIYNATGAMVR